MKRFGIFSSTGKDIPNDLWPCCNFNDPGEVWLITKHEDGKYSLPFHCNEIPNVSYVPKPKYSLIYETVEDLFAVQCLNDVSIWFEWDSGAWFYRPWTAAVAHLKGEQLQAALEDHCGLLMDAQVVKVFEDLCLEDKRGVVLEWKKMLHNEWLKTQTPMTFTTSQFTMSSDTLFEDLIKDMKTVKKKPAFDWIVRSSGVFERTQLLEEK